MSEHGSQGHGSRSSGDTPVEHCETEPITSGMRPPARDGVPEAGSLVADKYRIDRVLGHGGMGTVFAATHQVSGKQIALKWMRPPLHETGAAMERFIGEARATARIDHPNVIDIYDVGLQGDSAYLVMELLRGESLGDRLERGVLNQAEAVATLMPCLRGVAAAHEKGVIHRDLKPDNIMLCEGPNGQPREPKVLDFGISKIGAGDEPQASRLTQTGMVMGTPHYMSPEQVRGTREVDERGDVYAFGVILYEMLTNAHPFEGDTYNELILQIATADPIPMRELNPSVDPCLEAVVLCAMARDADDRFDNVAEMAAALEPFAPGVRFSSVPGSGSNPSLPSGAQRASRIPALPNRQNPNPPKRWHRRATLLGALAVLAVTATIWAVGATREALDRDAPMHTTTPEQAPDKGTPSVPATTPAADHAPGTQPQGVARAATEEPPEGIIVPGTLGDVEAPEEHAGVAATPDQRERRLQRRKLRAKREGRAAAEKNSPKRQRKTSANAQPAAKPRELSERWDEELNTEAPAGPATPVPEENRAGELGLDDI